MPIYKILQVGKPSVETLVADGATHNDAFDALGLDRAADGQLLLNGATPVKGTDVVPGTGNATVTVHFNAQVKGA